MIVDCDIANESKQEVGGARRNVHRLTTLATLEKRSTAAPNDHVVACLLACLFAPKNDVWHSSPHVSFSMLCSFVCSFIHSFIHLLSDFVLLLTCFFAGRACWSRTKATTHWRILFAGSFFFLMFVLAVASLISECE